MAPHHVEFVGEVAPARFLALIGEAIVSMESGGMRAVTSLHFALKAVGCTECWHPFTATPLRRRGPLTRSNIGPSSYFLTCP
jgi:hypothetical protein